MSGFQDHTALSSQIPRHDQDPVERRRLLNLLAQRRYRLRRREKLWKKDFQVPSQPVHLGDTAHNSKEPQQDLLGLPVCLQNPSLESNVLSHEPENSFLSVCGASSLEPLDQGHPPYYSSEVQATIVSSLSSGGTVEDTIFSPMSLQETIADQLHSAEHDSMFSDFLQDQSISQTAIFANNPELSPSRAPISLENIYLQLNATSLSADYAISTPGLGVICAKVNIFNHIIGPGFSLDIWDPAALSPICLGVATRPCPPNFQPTYLQRSIQHHSVIDVLPWPSFRDRFLYTMSLPKELRPRIAQDDMPTVTLEIMMAAKDAGGGLRVWGSNAFLAENWEVGQTFYSKFWWALDESILRNSNQHRERRGEGRLRFNSLNTA